jgi:TMEM175 potassium channel family protein
LQKHLNKIEEGHFSMTEEDERNKSKGYRVDRLLALSDGVFAFALTLLVLDLVVPTLSTNPTSTDLWQGLSKEYISFINYILSFFIAAIWWNSHHRNFEHIRDSNTTLRMLNMFFLIWIATLPFFTKILDQYHSLQLSVALYAIDQAAAGLCLTLTWLYASRNNRLIDKNLTKTAIRFSTIRNIITPIFFIISIGISFIDTDLASFSWYGLIPIFIIVLRIEQRQTKPHNVTKTNK